MESIEDTFNELSKHKVRQVDMVGRPAKGPFGKRNIAVWTHPKDSHGAIEFAQVEDFSIDVRLHPSWSAAFWRDQHPLGIERASHITVVVRDLGKGKEFYQDALGGKLLHEEETAGYKKSAFFAVGEDTVVELTQPLSAATAEARDLEHAGEGLYGVTFKTRDLARAAQFLESKKQRIESGGPDSLVINREDSFGIGVGFTQRKIPNDQDSRIAAGSLTSRGGAQFEHRLLADGDQPTARAVEIHDTRIARLISRHTVVVATELR